MHYSSKLYFEPQLQSQGCVALNGAFLIHTTFGDAALRSEILGMFKEHLSDFNLKLNSHIDMAVWKFMTHSLKGAAAAVGAEQLAAAAAEWDRQLPPANQAARENVRRQFSVLVQTFDESASALGC